MSKFDRDAVLAALKVQVDAGVLTPEEADVKWTLQCQGELSAQAVCLRAEQIKAKQDYDAAADSKDKTDADLLAKKKAKADAKLARRSFVEALGLDPDSRFGWHVPVADPQLAAALEASARRLGFSSVFNNPSIELGAKENADFTPFNSPVVNPNELFKVADIFVTRVVKFALPKGDKKED